MKHVLVGIILASFYFGILIKTLPDYGINQDSPGKFIRGQTYLQVLTTGTDHFDQPLLPSPVLFYPGQMVTLTFPSTYENHAVTRTQVANIDPTRTIQQQLSDYQKRAGRQSIYKHNAFNLAYWNVQDKGHPPISDILMALSNRLFYEKLGWLGDVEAYHIYSVFLASVAVFLVFAFTSSIWGVLPALLSTVTLATYPLFFAESHFNIKDVPELTFFAATIMAFYFWVVKRTWPWYVIFLVSFFLAFGTKWNILFLPFILIPWCRSIKETNALRALLVAFLISVALLILLWPYLWVSPLARLLEIVNFYWIEGAPRIATKPLYYSLFPFQFVLTHVQPYAVLLASSMTPPVVLAGACIGIWSVVTMKKDKTRAGLLILLWLLVPIAKHMLLQVAVHGSTRQYMEFLPALAICAGIGGAKIMRWGSKRLTKMGAIILGLALYSFLLLPILIIYHPNQNLYFNSLFGGLSGAQRFFHLDYQTNYTNPFKQAVLWFNTHAEPNAKLALVDGTMIGIVPTWLRPDIDFGSHFSDVRRNGEYIITLTQRTDPYQFYYLYLERFLTPIHVITVRGVPVANIWRNSPTYLQKGMDRVKNIRAFNLERGQTTGGLYWSIDLGSPKKLISVTMTIPQTSCEKHNPKQMDMFWFELTGRTFSPYVIEKNPTTYELLFPAEVTSKVRFDDTKHFGDMTLSSCLYQGTVTNIGIVEQ